MTPSMLFVAGLGLTLVIASAIVIYLRPQLHAILVEICGSGERAAFWVSFSNVTITLVPLIFAMAYIPESNAGTTPVLELARQIKWALAGLLAAVLVLGWVISSFIRRQSVTTVETRQATPTA